MIGYRTKTPVAMVVFNRPEMTKIVFEAVRKAQPYKLYIIQDGPRKGNKKDAANGKLIQEIFNDIDWECEVFRNISDVNLGCCQRPYTGFNWVFQNEETAIILEDDCVPSLDFFKFCDYILEKYKTDERIMLISGTNINGSWKRGKYSYHFSAFGGIHGWASWRRAWEKNDIEIKSWNQATVKNLIKMNISPRLYLTRKPIYDELVNNSKNVSSWDYQWGFARLINNGAAVVPCENLITNIGFGTDSTHTTNFKAKTANIALGNMHFPLIDPPFVMIDREYDEKFVESVSRPMHRVYMSRIKRMIFGIFR